MSPKISSKSAPKLIRPFGHYQYWKEIAEKIEEIDDQLKKAVKKAAEKRDLKGLRNLINLWERLSTISPSELPQFYPFLKNPEEVYRFADYVSKESFLGFNLAVSLAKWIRNPEIRGFRNKKELTEKFNNNGEKIGLIYYGRPLESEEEYLKVIKEIIADPETKLAMWEAPGIGRRPRLVYILGKNGVSLLVSIDEEGFIENCEAVEKGWDYFLIKGKEYVDAFYEIDKESVEQD